MAKLPAKADLSRDEMIPVGHWLRILRRFWWAAAICMAGCIVISLLYLKVKSPVYRVNASFAINQNEDSPGTSLGSGMNALLSTFSLGGSGSRSTEDEIFRMTSQNNLEEVARLSGVYLSQWSKKSLLSRKVWYYDDSPVRIELPPAVLDTIRRSTRFSIDYKAADRKWHLKVKQGKEQVIDREIPGLPFLAKTPCGMFRIDITKDFNPRRDLNYRAQFNGLAATAEGLREDLDIGPLSKKSDIIWILYDDANPKRGEAVVNTLVEVYNRNSLEVMHDQARQNLEFLDRRLLTLYSELDTSESRIADFKKRNNIVDPAAEAEYIFKQKAAAQEAGVDLESRVAILRMTIDFLSDEANRYAVVPFTNDVPGEPIKAYNELVLQRMRIASNVKGNTSTLNLLTQQVDAMRSTMLTTLRTHLKAAEASMSSIRGAESKADSRIAGAPAMEKQLTAMLRERTVKNYIYGYLLQKREESEMKLARLFPAAQIVDEAYENVEPTSPKKWLVLAVGVIAGFICSSISIILLNRLWIPRRKE